MEILKNGANLDFEKSSPDVRTRVMIEVFRRIWITISDDRGIIY